MTKSELIDAVARRTQITKSRAELVVNCVFDSMTAALERGEGIEIRGFGSFTVREYKPYNGRNPRTGRAVPVPRSACRSSRSARSSRNWSTPVRAPSRPTMTTTMTMTTRVGTNDEG